MRTWPRSVKIVFLNNPLSFHKRAKAAALAALAAHKQGEFWRYHNQLMANQKALSNNDLERYARELCLNIPEWKKDKATPPLSAQINNEQKATVAMKHGGTPAFFINGIPVAGAQPFETFKKHIESEISAANRLMSAGLPLVVVHNKRVGINQGAKAKQYWSSVIMGRAAPRASKPVDPTVWKAEMFGHEPVMGKKNALVTVMAFMEFQ